MALALLLDADAYHECSGHRFEDVRFSGHSICLPVIEQGRRHSAWQNSGSVEAARTAGTAE
jgi:hypothetical protein